VHKAAAADDKKLQATLKRLGVNNLPSIEEVRSNRGCCRCWYRPGREPSTEGKLLLRVVEVFL
jgi:hypothetical protein